MSTVAGAVVTIDGDSSGLVGALQKGEKAIGGVKTEARKLTDQLKEVADDADRAAGALAERIGGPGAIKAIGAVGIAAGVAKAGVEAFLDSSEALFKSYGEEGQKVWDDTEKSLFAIKGAFAEAVLGGGSVEEMGARLKSIFEAVKVALDALLLPVRGLSALVRGLAGAFDEVSGNVVEASDKLDQLASKTRLDGLVKTGEGIEGLRAKLMQLRGDTAGLLQLEIQRDINAAQALKTQILATELQADAIASAAAVAGAQGRIEKAANEKQQEYIRSLGEEQLTHAQLAEARRIYNEEKLAQGQAVMAQQMKQREGVSAANKAQLDELDAQIAAFQKLATTKTAATGGGGGGSAPKVNEAEEAAKAAAAGLAGIVKSSATQTAEGIEAIKAAAKSLYEALGMRDPNEPHLFSDIVDGIEAAKTAVADGLQWISDARAARAAEAEAQREKELADEKALKKTIFDVTVMTNAKMLGAAIAANKSMAEVARAAIGNIVSALGDMAMAKASAYAVEGNFAQATGMAVVGTTMYGIASALGAQKKPNAGPPTERQQPVQNYAYNLRIDAAFADSESISRRFAQMQEGARQRGLIAGAA